jgi:hypothetical protein
LIFSIIRSLVVVGTTTSTSIPRRAPTLATAWPALPPLLETSARLPASRWCAHSHAIPRSLKLPDGWFVSSFKCTVQLVVADSAGDGMSGVGTYRPSRTRAGPRAAS